MKRGLVWLTMMLVPCPAFGQPSGGLPALQSDLNAERERATAAEQTISSSLTTATGNIDAEATRAKAVEATLDGKIQSELTQRVNADSALASDQAMETAAREQGDADALAAANAHIDTSVAAEAFARKEGDATTLAAAKTYCDQRPAPQAVRVLDATGRELGALIDMTFVTDESIAWPVTDVTYRIMLADGSIWRLPVSSHAIGTTGYFTSTAAAIVNWGSSDCTGQVYLDWKGTVTLPAGTVIHDHGGRNVPFQYFVVTERRSAPAWQSTRNPPWSPDGSCVSFPNERVMAEVDGVQVDPSLCGRFVFDDPNYCEPRFPLAIRRY